MRILLLLLPLIFCLDFAQASPRTRCVSQSGRVADENFCARLSEFRCNMFNKRCVVREVPNPAGHCTNKNRYPNSRLFCERRGKLSCESSFQCQWLTGWNW
jgi:hypothetical protein